MSQNKFDCLWDENVSMKPKESVDGISHLLLLEGGVSFWRSDVTLTCPRNGTWFQHNTQLDKGETYVLKYERPIRVHCVYEEAADTYEEKTTKKTFFFVKGRGEKN